MECNNLCFHSDRQFSYRAFVPVFLLHAGTASGNAYGYTEIQPVLSVRCDSYGYIRYDLCRCILRAAVSGHGLLPASKLDSDLCYHQSGCTVFDLLYHSHKSLGYGSDLSAFGIGRGL